MNFTLQMFVHEPILRATLQQNITFELKKNSLNTSKNSHFAVPPNSKLYFQLTVLSFQTQHNKLFFFFQLKCQHTIQQSE